VKDLLSKKETGSKVNLQTRLCF